MTTNEPKPTVHAHCVHLQTKADRAACRKVRKAVVDARNARLDNIIRQLDTDLGGQVLLHRVCLRYSDPRRGRNHDDHSSHRDCAGMIADYIDYTAKYDNYTVPENNLRSHAYMMFS